MTQARAKTVQQEREEVYAVFQYAASFHCLVEEWNDCEELMPQPKEKWSSVDKNRKETRDRTEWCAAAGKYRCIRCGRGSKHMKMQGKNTGPENGESDIWEDTTCKKNGQVERSSDLVQKMFGFCTTENGTKVDELWQAGENGHERIWKDVQNES